MTNNIGQEGIYYGWGYGCLCSFFHISRIADLKLSFFSGKRFFVEQRIIYASKQEREHMNKKPHYRQSAIVFLMLGINFLLSFTALVLDADWLYWLAGIMVAVTIVYAIVSSIMIENDKKS